MKYFSIIPLIFILTACEEEPHAVQPNTYVKSSEIVNGMDGCRRLEIRHASSSSISPYDKEIVYQCDNSTTAITRQGKKMVPITILNGNVQLYTKEQSEQMCLESIKSKFNQ